MTGLTITPEPPKHAFTNTQGLLYEYNGYMQIHHWLSKLPEYVREWLGPCIHNVSSGPHAGKPDIAFPDIGVEAEFKYRAGSRPVDDRQVTRERSGVIHKEWSANDKSCIYEGPNRHMTQGAYYTLSLSQIAVRRSIRGFIRHLEALISKRFPLWQYLERWTDGLVAINQWYDDPSPIVNDSKIADFGIDTSIRIGGSTYGAIRREWGHDEYEQYYRVHDARRTITWRGGIGTVE